MRVFICWYKNMWILKKNGIDLRFLFIKYILKTLFNQNDYTRTDTIYIIRNYYTRVDITYINQNYYTRVDITHIYIL